MGEVQIPTEAYDIADKIAATYADQETAAHAAAEAIQAAAPLILAAELERLAQDLVEQWGQRADDVRGPGLNEAVRQVQARVRELRGEG